MGIVMALLRWVLLAVAVVLAAWVTPDVDFGGGPLSALVEVDVLHLDRRPGDVWMLCSDGLSSYLTDRQISRVMNSAAGWQEKTDKLVDMALENGTTDNVTCVIVTDEEAER